MQVPNSNNSGASDGKITINNLTISGAAESQKQKPVTPDELMAQLDRIAPKPNPDGEFVQGRPDLLASLEAKKADVVVPPVEVAPQRNIIVNEPGVSETISTSLGESLSTFAKQTGIAPSVALLDGAQENLYGAAKTNPDQQNDIDKTADKMGVDREAIPGEDALIVAKSALLMRGYDPDKLARLHPETVDWLARNPDNAKVVSDDLAGVNGVSKIIAGAIEQNRDYELMNTRGELGAKLADGTITDEERLKLNDILNEEASAHHYNTNSLLFGFGKNVFGGTRAMAQDFAMGAGETAKKLPVTVAAAAFVPGLSQLGAGEIASATFLWAMHDVQSRREYGNQYLTLRMMSDRDGNKLTEDQAKMGAWFMGEAAGLGALVDSHIVVKALAVKPIELLGAKFVAGEIAKEKFGQEVAMAALQKYAVDVGTVGAVSAGQSLFNTLTTEGIKSWNNMKNKSQFDSVGLGNAISKAAGDGVNGAFGAALPIALLSHLGIRSQHKAIFTMAENLKAAADLKAAAESSIAVGQRGSKRPGTLFQSADGSKASKSAYAYIDADGFRAMFGDGAQVAAEKVGVGKEFSESKAGDGTKLAIKTQDYFANYRELFQDKELQDWYTNKPDQLSRSELKVAQEINAEKDAKIEEAQQASNRIQARRMVEQDIKDKMVKAGQSPGRAGVVAKILSHIYDAVQLKSKNDRSTALDLYKRKPIDWKKRNAIYDSAGVEQRGSFEIGDEANLIQFSKISDGTTAFHEVGHHILDVLSNLDLDGMGNPELKNSLDAALEYIGAKRGKIDAAAHEKFATLLEEWLQNGMAPEPGSKSDRLQALFTATKKIFTNVYGDAEAMKSSPITALFAKMMGMEDAIKAAEVKAGEEAKVPEQSKPGKTNENIGLNKKSYNKKVAELIKRVLDKVTIAKKKSFKEIEMTAKAQAVSEVKNSDFFKAGRFLKSGKLEIVADDGTVVNVAADLKSQGVKNKIQLFDLEELHKQGAISDATFKRLKSFADLSGMPLGEFAMLFGREGDSIKFLEEIDSLAVNADKVIEQRAAQIMLDSGMDKFINHDELGKLALDTVLTDSKYKSIAEQIRGLRRLAGLDGGVNIDGVRLKAISDISSEIGVKVSLPGYAEKMLLKAEKSSREAKKALANGDYLKAAEKNKEYLENLIKREEIQKAAKQAKADIELMHSIKDKLPAVFMGNEKLAGVLERLLEIVATEKRSSADVLGGRQTLNAWVKELQADTFRIEIPAEVIDANERLGVDEMKLRTLHSTAEFVRNVIALAKAELEIKKAIKNGDKVSISTEAVNVLRENFPGRFKDYENGKLNLVQSGDRPAADKNDWVLRGMHKLNSLTNQVRIMEFVFRKLDGDKPDGFFTKTFFRPIAEGWDKYHNETNESLAAYGAEIKKYIDAGEDIEAMTYNKFLNRRVSKETILSIALNCGSESNMEAFLDGNKFGLTGDNIHDFLNQSLSKKDIDFCNSVWALINKDKDRIEYFMRVEKKGERVPMIEASSIKLSNGTLEGGYFPLEYHGVLNTIFDQKVQEARNLLSTGSIDGIARVRTKAGFANERVGSGGKEVSLSLSAVNRHMAEVYMALNMAEPVRNVNELLRTQKVKDAINIAAGDGMTESMNSWLEQTIGKLRSRNVDSPVVNYFRSNSVKAMLLFKPMTSLLQSLGYLTIMDEVGVGRTLQAMAEVSGNPMKFKAIHASIMEKSIHMKNRVDTRMREFVDIANGSKNKAELARKGFDHAGMWMLHSIQSAVDDAAWTAGYRKALELNPRDEAGAIAYADSVVRTTQTTSAKYGQSELIGSEDAWVKLWTTFGSYGNMVLNRVGARIDKLERNGLPNLPEFIGGMTALVIAPAIAEQYIRGRGLKSTDEKDMREFFGGITNNTVLQMVPLGSLISGRGSAVTGNLKSISYTLSKIYNKNADAYDYAKVGSNAAGMLWGFPSSQTNNIINYYQKFSDGEDPSPLEIIAPQPRGR